MIIPCFIIAYKDLVTLYEYEYFVSPWLMDAIEKFAVSRTFIVYGFDTAFAQIKRSKWNDLKPS